MLATASLSRRLGHTGPPGWVCQCPRNVTWPLVESHTRSKAELCPLPLIVTWNGVPRDAGGVACVTTIASGVR